MIHLSLRSNQFVFTLCWKSKSKECKMSGSFAWVCICILEGGHFSIPDADADPGMTELALKGLGVKVGTLLSMCPLFLIQNNFWSG